MNILLWTIFLPIGASLLCFIFRRAAGGAALIVSAVGLALGAKIFLAGQLLSPLLALRAYPFSASLYLAASFLTFLIVLYSLKFMAGKERLGEYYGYILITLGAAAGAFFATDFLTLLMFWGLLGIPLYMLIGLGGDGAGGAAKKALMIVGGADALMIIGIGLVWCLTGTLRVGGALLPLEQPLTVIAFFCLLAGAFAKAGVMPLHGWIPAAAESAPAPVLALLPASLDKLLGIYLLARLCYDVFLVTPNSAVSFFLLALGSLTIMAAVLGALVQHDLKKLLAFHAVSQVGYMVVGIGTGLPLGVAGGLFHMFNNAIYKSCLFLCGGAVEFKNGTTDLSKLGGLAKTMPLTFAAFLIAAFSISGVPPLNGFVSKWLIYQSLIELSKINAAWIIWLAAAMLGSACTAASFVKITHAVFLGRSEAKAREVHWTIWLAPVTLAALCVVFGLGAYQLPLRFLIAPAVGLIGLIGVWDPLLAAGLILVSLSVGLLIYFLGNVDALKTRPIFAGGEELPAAGKVSGVDFYDTVRQIRPLALIYRAGEKRWFDFYELSAALLRWSSAWLVRLDAKIPGIIPWLRRDRAFKIKLLGALIAAELLVEGLLLVSGVREILTGLAALAMVAAAFYLAGRLGGSYANE
ncbi:MAG: NADH-quinone oxidoreductase subunit L [Candidatus Saganbacteria bacterium]|nr:NADH-quinone oxidoreductase subunit L [Candidatus Saganbacteria bacterium]